MTVFTAHPLNAIKTAAARCIPATLRTRALNTASAFPRREDGTAAIEFALIAPLMIGIYLGMYQVSMVIIQDRNVSHSASVLGDLASQKPVLEVADIEDSMQGAVEVIAVGNAATLSTDVDLELSSYRMLTDGTVERVGYAATTQGGAWTPVDTATIDPRMLNDVSGAVVARVRYNYRILADTDATVEDGTLDTTAYIDADKDGIMLAEQFVLKPRVSTNFLPFVTPATGTDGRAFDCQITNRIVSCTDAGPAL